MRVEKRPGRRDPYAEFWDRLRAGAFDGGEDRRPVLTRAPADLVPAGGQAGAVPGADPGADPGTGPGTGAGSVGS